MFVAAMLCRIAEWMKQEPERKRKRAEEKERKRRQLLDEPRHFFNDPQYMQQLETAEEGMSDALKQGLQAASGSKSGSSVKRRADGDDAGPSKKTKLW